MSIGDYILKVGSGVEHLVSGVFALDCVNNISQGNYPLAAIEGVAAAYIQIMKAMDRDQRRIPEGMSANTEQLNEQVGINPIPVLVPSSYSGNLEDMIGPPINYFGKEKF